MYELVVVESPFRGKTKLEEQRNVLYAQRACYDSMNRGEFPFASHLLYTQMLDDRVDKERNWGIEGQLAWMGVCDKVVVYDDYGVSAGMQAAIEHAEKIGKQVSRRRIGQNGG